MRVGRPLYFKHDTKILQQSNTGIEFRDNNIPKNLDTVEKEGNGDGKGRKTAWDRFKQTCGTAQISYRWYSFYYQYGACYIYIYIYIYIIHTSYVNAYIYIYAPSEMAYTATE
jgi:hypothetical protein